MFGTPSVQSKFCYELRKNVDTERLINDARSKTCLRDSNTDDYKDKFKSFSASHCLF